MIKGIDVSTYQDASTTPKRIDWTRPALYDVKFVINRAVFVAAKDDDFDYNWEQQRGKYLRGAYGFWGYWPGASSIDAQVRALVDALKNDPGEMPVIWADVEKASSSYPDIPDRTTALPLLERYMKGIEDGLGKGTGIYTNLAGIFKLSPIPQWLLDKPLWFAWPFTPPAGETAEEYIERTGLRPPVKGWPSYKIWQYSWKGPGLQMGMESHGLDMNYFNGTEKDLLDWCGQNAGDGDGGSSMFEDKMISLYIKSDYKVTDWDALCASVDGVVFVRAGYVPLTARIDPVSGKTLYYPNYDTAKNDDDLLREDPDYRTSRSELRKRGKKVIPVFEYNPFYDKDSNWSGKNQVAQIKRILRGLDNAMGDAICIQVTYNQWIENSGVVTIPATNFKKGVSLLFQDLFAEFKQTVYGWSRSNVIKFNDGHYNYLEQFVTWLDGANRGEPTWPFGFTYLPAAWKKVWGASVNTLRESINLAPALTTSEADSELRIGSYTGWGMKNQAGNAYNHGFYALFGTYLPFIKDASGKAVMVEPIIIDTDEETWFSWMGWDITPPENDTTPPSMPAGLTHTLSGSTVSLTWQPSTDNVGVVEYGVYRDAVLLGPVAAPGYVDTTVPDGTHTYQVDAVDAAGNRSYRATIIVTVGGGGSGDVPRVEFDALKAEVSALSVEIAALHGQVEKIRAAAQKFGQEI